MEDQVMIRGSVASVVYQNEDNGYAIIRLLTEDAQTISVVGTIPLTTVGERLIVTGKWGQHPSYGRQFEAEFLERLMPESSNEIFQYLASRTVKGIGEKTASRIVEAFGDKSLDIIENDPEQLAQVPGISMKKAGEISEAFRKQVGIRRLIEFMSTHQLPVELALKLFRVFGDLAVEALRDDPYLLADRDFGAEFSKIDVFAMELGVEGDDERRVEAGILFELSHNLGNGHTFLPMKKLTIATANLLHLEAEIIEEGMLRLHTQGRMVEDELRGIAVCYLPEYYEAETYIAERIAFMASEQPEIPRDLQEHMASIQSGKMISYAKLQAEAICTAVSHQVVLVTGGPGTGKTTTLDGILDMFDRLNISAELAAPTGRAAKRLAELTGREATTIHRLLEPQYSPESGSLIFYHDEDEPLDVEAMVIDETSMVDVMLMQSLLRALPQGCRLVLVGDPDQLPSVGAGNVFSDLIRSGAAATVRLTEIFRQAQESLIVMNAHAINQGVFPDLTKKDKDFFFMKRRSAQSVVETICELCATRLPDNMGIASSDIQVLSPTRKFETGTVYLNEQLQAALNPPSETKKEKQIGNFLFREGDRVMQIRNNYDILWKKPNMNGSGSGVFNGDIGLISQINFTEETMTVLFDDKEAKYSFDMLIELELAYAMTVHKSQGSEYKAVILAAWHGSPYLLSRNILYTAVTRARQLLIIVGNEEIIAKMTTNDKQQKRYSGLKLRLQKGGVK